jgi:hypothetical protein
VAKNVWLCGASQTVDPNTAMLKQTKKYFPVSKCNYMTFRTIWAHCIILNILVGVISAQPPTSKAATDNINVGKANESSFSQDSSSTEKIFLMQREESSGRELLHGKRPFSEYGFWESLYTGFPYGMSVLTIILSTLVLLGIDFAMPLLLLPQIICYAFFFCCIAIFVMFQLFMISAILLRETALQPEDLATVGNIGIILLACVFYSVFHGYIFMCLIRCCQLIALENKIKKEQRVLMMMNQLNDSSQLA